MVKSARRRLALLAGAVLLAGAALWFVHDGVLLRVVRTGGVAGVHDAVVIWGSGGVTVAGEPPLRSQLTAAQHRRLRAALDAADFAHMPGRHFARGADMFVYQVGYARWSVATNAPQEVPGLSDVLSVPLEVIRAARER